MSEFKATEEQQASLALAQENQLVKIESGSGCGKTSSLKFISTNIREQSLYVAFNKSMADDARAKFPPHVACMTLHSLAYGSVGNRYQHKLSRPTGRYVNVGGTGNELAKLFRIPEFIIDDERKLTSAYIGLIVRLTCNKFEQSADLEVSHKHIPGYFLKEITERYPDADMKRLEKLVEKYARRLWEERTDVYSDVLCTHDTYLKLYQLSNPDLSQYKVIYLDEAQDSNDVTLELVLKQQEKGCKIIIVGDQFQSIYQWRGSVNAMKKVDCPCGSLSKSFRFGQPIADIANAILGNKTNLTGNENVDSKVSSYMEETSAVDFNKPYTILFRKNMTLIYRAIDLIEEGVSVSINIDTRDFVNMLKSAQELYHGNIHKVKHEDIVPYADWIELKEEAKNDGSLSKLVSMVEQGQAPRVIDILHNYEKGDNAHVTLTTSHKAKGLEYDQVVLADDYPSNYNSKGKFVGLTEEEENLLYVAATRAKVALQYNQTVEECLTIYKKGSQAIPRKHKHHK